MKMNLALLAAGAIILTPALAAASQPAQPPTGTAQTQSTDEPAPKAAATTDQASDTCATAKASDKTANAKDPAAKSASKDESVKKITRDTGIADATPAPKPKKTDKLASC